MEDFKKFNTSPVQVRSLLNFMYALGYALDEDSKSGRFVTKIKLFQGNRFLSSASAVKLHNMKDTDWEFNEEEQAVYPKGIQLQCGFNPFGLRLAVASKLVAQVKLSVTRHGNVVTQDHMIKPMNPNVYDMVEPAAK